MEASSFIQVRLGGVAALRGMIGKDRLVALKSGSTLYDLIDKLERRHTKRNAGHDYERSGLV